MKIDEVEPSTPEICPENTVIGPEYCHPPERSVGRVRRRTKVPVGQGPMSPVSVPSDRKP